LALAAAALILPDCEPTGLTEMPLNSGGIKGGCDIAVELGTDGTVFNRFGKLPDIGTGITVALVVDFVFLTG